MPEAILHIKTNPGPWLSELLNLRDKQLDLQLGNRERVVREPTYLFHTWRAVSFMDRQPPPNVLAPHSRDPAQ